MDLISKFVYLENSKDEFPHFNSHFQNGINLCCFIKSIYRDKNTKIINVILENIFDFNSIILEIPQNDEILQNLYINCIYLFINFNIFIDEKMNIKLTVQKSLSSKSKIIFLYFLIDPDKYMNKKYVHLIQTRLFFDILLDYRLHFYSTLANHFQSI